MSGEMCGLFSAGSFFCGAEAFALAVKPADKLVNGNPEKIRHGDNNGKIRFANAPFVFADGGLGYVKSLRKLKLGHLFLFS